MNHHLSKSNEHLNPASPNPINSTLFSLTRKSDLLSTLYTATGLEIKLLRKSLDCHFNTSFSKNDKNCSKKYCCRQQKCNNSPSQCRKDPLYRILRLRK
jgi:hypothetical protein